MSRHLKVMLASTLIHLDSCTVDQGHLSLTVQHASFLITFLVWKLRPS